MKFRPNRQYLGCDTSVSIRARVGRRSRPNPLVWVIAVEITSRASSIGVWLTVLAPQAVAGLSEGKPWINFISKVYFVRQAPWLRKGIPSGLTIGKIQISKLSTIEVMSAFLLY